MKLFYPTFATFHSWPPAANEEFPANTSGEPAQEFPLSPHGTHKLHILDTGRRRGPFSTDR